MAQEESRARAGSTLGKIFESIIYHFALIASLATAIGVGIYKFSRLETQIEVYTAQQEKQVENLEARRKEEVEILREQLAQQAALQNDIERARAAIEALRCSFRRLEFDPVSAKCTGVPAPSSQRERGGQE